MNIGIECALLLVTLTRVASAYEITATGTLLSDFPVDKSGTRSEIHLETAEGPEYILHPMPNLIHFKDNDCRRPGAIWTVTAYVNEFREAWLRSATCSGRVDPLVRTAFDASVGFVELLIAGQAAEAYIKMSAWSQIQHSQDDLVKTSSLRRLPFVQLSTCLGINSVQERVVMVEVRGPCLTNRDGKLVKLFLAVDRSPASRISVFEMPKTQPGRLR